MSHEEVILASVSTLARAEARDHATEKGCYQRVTFLEKQNFHEVTIVEVAKLCCLCLECSDHTPSVFVKSIKAKILASCLKEEDQVIIAEAGAIPALVALLAYHNPVAKMEAARTLSNLASKAAFQPALIGAGTIPALVAALSKGNQKGKENATLALYYLAENNDPNKAAIVAAGGNPALEALEKTQDKALEDARLWARQILNSLPRGSNGDAANSGDAGPDAGPAPRPKASPKAPSVEMVRAEVQALENSKDEQKAKVAEQLGTWAAVSDDNRVAISREGGADALVALVVTGSDDAKWQRALRNLAHNGESKKAICEGWWHYGIGTPCQAWRRKIARGCQ